MRAHEAIRVVPVHHPKPRVRISNKRAAAPVKAKLTYRGGPLIETAEVFTVFWGKSWGTAGALKALTAPIDKFFADILVSPLIDQLSEYNVEGKKIGHGQFIGSKVITAGVPAASVTDSAIQTALQKWITAGKVPTTNANSLYFIFLEEGVTSVMGGSRSCQSYCGYHNNVGDIYYAAMPYPGCSGCLGGLDVLNALTGTSSHELCEAITDPVPGTGWYDDAQGEIGDICAWQFKQMGSHTIQLEWSNSGKKCG